MPVRVGVDLVSVARMRESLERFGEKLVQRVFTRDEIAYCRAGGESAAERFAARFAAKEATLKVLRVESAWMALLPSIEVRRSPGGWCDLRLHGDARAIARRRGISGWSVSLSHEAGSAIAVVAAEVRRALEAGEPCTLLRPAPRPAVGARRGGRSKREDGR